MLVAPPSAPRSAHDPPSALSPHPGMPRPLPSLRPAPSLRLRSAPASRAPPSTPPSPLPPLPPLSPRPRPSLPFSLLWPGAHPILPLPLPRPSPLASPGSAPRPCPLLGGGGAGRPSFGSTSAQVMARELRALNPPPELHAGSRERAADPGFSECVQRRGRVRDSLWSQVGEGNVRWTPSGRR